MLAKLKKKMYFVVAGYFRFFANFVLRRWQPRILAITGSAGKTTLLNLMEKQLGKKAHYSHNANSAFGVAFDIMGFDGIRGSKLRWLWLFILAPIRAMYFSRKENIYVVEIDAERPHEADFLARWLKPEVVAWVSFGLSHAVKFEEVVKKGKFQNVERAILYEFGRLARYAERGVVISGDNTRMQEEIRRVMKERRKDELKITEVSLANLKKYTVMPKETIFEVEGEEFTFDHAEPREVGVQVMMMREIMKYLNEEVKYDLRGTRIAPGRSATFMGKKSTILIDSSYNAHMVSMETMLGMMKAMKVEKKWLMISDIVEQGNLEKKEHMRLGKIIAEVGAERVILVGRRVNEYTAEVLKKIGVEYEGFSDVKNAVEWLLANVKGGEVILFKGSQYLEWAVEKMLFNKKDAKYLARREKAAVKRRKKWGLE